MIPKYKIEVYHGANLIHTITDVALTLHVRDLLTSGTGTFCFNVPTVKGLPTTFEYNDVVVHDKVKIWLGYDSVSGDPNFVGRICRVNAPLTNETGYSRVFEGKLQSEILQRRIKSFKYWQNVGVSAIVAELAGDLGLGTSQIESDSTAVTLKVEGETYEDVLRKVSDYWYDGDTRILKDFYVDIGDEAHPNGHLVWASRDGTAPFRSGANVETLTVGTNILSYNIVRDVLSVKNSVNVYGTFDEAATSAKDPQDENWTENLTNWTKEFGEDLQLTSGYAIVGNYGLICFSAVDDGYYRARIRRSFEPDFDWVSGRANTTRNSYSRMSFYTRNIGGSGGDVTQIWIKLYAPDSSNYFRYFASNIILPPQLHTLWLDEPYDTTGSPDYDNIRQIVFDFSAIVDRDYVLDGFYFRGGRFHSSASNSTSQTDYGLREMVSVDDMLYSDTDCQRRAETLLYQLKEPAVRADLTVVGNANIKIGDRLSLTIPAEGISSQSFDVVSVEHDLNMQGFTTKLSAMGLSTESTADIRQLPPVTVFDVIAHHAYLSRSVARGLEVIR